MALDTTTVLQSVLDDFNTSTLQGTLDDQSQYTYGERVFYAVTVTFIAILGIVGNATVLVAVALSCRLHTVTNVFVVNLSVADLIMCVLGLVNTAIVLIRGGLPPSLEGLCQMLAFTNPSMVGVILFSIAAIAVNRMLLITRHSTVYRNTYTAPKLVPMLVAIWLVPFMVTGILLATGIGKLSYNNRVHLCLDDSEHQHSVLYKTLLAAILYPGPATITIVSYGIIYTFLRRHFKKERQACSSIYKRSFTATATSSQSQDTSTVDLGVSSTVNTLRKKRVHRQQIQITKNLFIVACFCFLLPLPNCIFIMVGLDKLFLYGIIFLFANSAVNPLLYGAKHPMFKEVMMCILQGQWSQIPEPSRILKALLSRG